MFKFFTRSKENELPSEIRFSLSNGEEKICLIKRNPRAKRIILKRSKTNELVLVLPEKLKIKVEALKNFLLQQEDWIIKTQKPELLPPNTINFPALNEEWNIEYLISGSEKAKIRIDNKNKAISIEGASNIKEISQLLNKFTLQKAKKFLQQRLEYNKEQHNFINSEKLRILFLKSRWGSYSSKNVLTLNARLIQLPLEYIDYVIVHELCHSKNLNHSKHFYALLGEKIPHYRQIEKELEKFQISPFFWL